MRELSARERRAGIRPGSWPAWFPSREAVRVRKFGCLETLLTLSHIQASSFSFLFSVWC